jgi:hypothetical protein
MASTPTLVEVLAFVKIIVAIDKQVAALAAMFRGNGFRHLV